MHLPLVYFVLLLVDGRGNDWMKGYLSSVRRNKWLRLGGLSFRSEEVPTSISSQEHRSSLDYAMPNPYKGGILPLGDAEGSQVSHHKVVVLVWGQLIKFLSALVVFINNRYYATVCSQRISWALHVACMRRNSLNECSSGCKTGLERTKTAQLNNQQEF